MGFIIRIILAVIVAGSLGLWTALWSVDQFGASGAARNGAWGINTDIGSSAADPYTRAFVARFGLLALNKTEAIYFAAETDDAGAPLDGNCAYRISGSRIPALWWSITAYGPDAYLIPNSVAKYSVFGPSVVSETGDYEIFARPKSDGTPLAAELPITPGSEFSLTLRLYLPDQAVVEDPNAFIAPSIVKEQCQ